MKGQTLRTSKINWNGRERVGEGLRAEREGEEGTSSRRGEGGKLIGEFGEINCE